MAGFPLEGSADAAKVKSGRSDERCKGETDAGTHELTFGFVPGAALLRELRTCCHDAD
jgi:hypothetical protein